VARPEVVLRLVRAEDELNAAALLAGEFAEWARGRILAEYGIGLELENSQGLLSDLEGLRMPRARLYLAEVAGEPIGVGGLKPLGSDDAEIKRMYVRPSVRGLGVGAAILGRLIDDARALGYRKIHLDTGRFMVEAQSLYRRFGFVPSGPQEGWEFESVPAMHETAVFMSLDLG
jgi:GNAT superfamily N-acetyltransferase